MSSFSKDPKTILFIAANPKDTGRLRLDQELRDIAEGLQRAQKRDQFNLEQRLAVRPRDIQRAMLDVEPQIIHFSGHGGGEQGLVFEDDIGNIKLMDGFALAGLFELFADKIACVVLNGCYSEVQAKAIAHHIPYVIGMNQTIGDKAAIAFAVGFYDALGAGRGVEFAYKLGCAAIRLEGIAEYLTPVLLEQSITGAATIQPNLAVPSPPTSPTPARSSEQVQAGHYGFKLLGIKVEAYPGNNPPKLLLRCQLRVTDLIGTSDYVDRQTIRLVVEGAELLPENSINTAIYEKQSQQIEAVFIIPADVTQVVLLLGRQNEGATRIPIDLQTKL
jgi:hypothetical protein